MIAACRGQARIVITRLAAIAPKRALPSIARRRDRAPLPAAGATRAASRGPREIGGAKLRQRSRPGAVWGARRNCGRRLAHDSAARVDRCSSDVSRQHCRRCGLLASAALLLEADRQEERCRAKADHLMAAALHEVASLLEEERRPAEAGHHEERRPAMMMASRWVADLPAAWWQQHPPRRRRLLCLRDGLRSTRLSISERITETTRLARPRGATSEGVARHSSKRACRRWRHSSTEIFFRRPPKTCRAGVPQSGHFTSSISRRAGR